jgi:flagellar motor switch protein FliM
MNKSTARIRENVSIIRQHMSTTSLPLVAELGHSTISLYDLLNLKVGDAIRLNNRINEEVEVRIAGRKKFAARPGSVEGKKSVKIVRLLNDDEVIE